MRHKERATRLKFSPRNPEPSGRRAPRQGFLAVSPNLPERTLSPPTQRLHTVPERIDLLRLQAYIPLRVWSRNPALPLPIILLAPPVCLPRSQTSSNSLKLPVAKTQNVLNPSPSPPGNLTLFVRNHGCFRMLTGVICYSCADQEVTENEPDQVQDSVSEILVHPRAERCGQGR